MKKIKIKTPYMGIEGIDLKIVVRKWIVKNNDNVNKNDIIAEIENEFAILELPAEVSGKITIIKQEGEITNVGDVICIIDVED
jgi:2-oxoglutarate dehydrogenase E2 component (dihydrolipoamide succinyltransferase)